METIKLYRHLPDEVDDFDMTIQLPEGSKYDMCIMAEPLINEIGGTKGLLYTARFRYSDIERVKEFFKEKGFSTSFFDERERDKKFDELGYYD